MKGNTNIKIESALKLENKKFLEAGEAFELVIPNIINPISLKESETFRIRLSDSEIAYVISEQAEGITVKNKEKSRIVKEVQFESMNPVLNADTTFRVEFMPRHPLPFNA